MYYYLYEIKNNVNNKIYVGVHETDDLDDGYMGSGKLIQSAIKKYGVNNFTKTILQFFDTSENMYVKEAEIVNESFVSRKDTYNIANGGSGGSIKQNRKPFNKKHTEETKLKMSKANSNRIVSEETRKKLRDTNWAKTNPEKQKQHAIKAGKMRWSDDIHPNHLAESKIKISNSLKLFNENRKKLGLKNLNSGLIRAKVKCPHCQKEGAMNTMSRFHFDNCKFMVNESEVVEPNDCESL